MTSQIRVHGTRSCPGKRIQVTFLRLSARSTLIRQTWLAAARNARRSEVVKSVDLINPFSYCSVTPLMPGRDKAREDPHGCRPPINLDTGTGSRLPVRVRGPSPFDKRSRGTHHVVGEPANAGGRLSVVIPLHRGHGTLPCASRTGFRPTAPLRTPYYYPHGRDFHFDIHAD